MSANRPMNAVVVGGGVAGLAAAVGCRLVGIDAVVYERVPRYAARGFGFLLLPNGLRALQSFGLLDQVRAAGYPITHAVMRASDGAVLASEDLAEAVCISRTDLLEILLNALPAQSVRTSTVFSGFEQGLHGSVSHARFANGEIVAADLFIGADGVNSGIRHRLYPDHPCVPGRVKELVCSVSAADLSAKVGGTFIKTLDPRGGLAFGLLPPGDARLIWFLQYDSHRWHLPDHDIGFWKDFVLTHVGEWPDPIPALLELTDFSHMHLWHTADMDPLPGLHAENIVLVGDAAHALLPFTSQGANSALEDAIELANCVSGEHNTTSRLPDALAEFDRVRRAPLQRYLQAGRELAAAFVEPGSREGAAMLPLVM